MTTGNFAYSALLQDRDVVSAAFHTSRKSWYAARAFGGVVTTAGMPTFLFRCFLVPPNRLQLSHGLIRNAQGASHWIPALHICRRDASRAKEEAYQFTRGGSPAECACDRPCPFPGASLFLLEMQIRKFVSHRRTRQEIQAPSARASDESPGFVCFSSPADTRCRAFHLLEQYGSRLARGAKSRSHSLAYQPWLAPLIALERGQR